MNASRSSRSWRKGSGPSTCLAQVLIPNAGEWSPEANAELKLRFFHRMSEPPPYESAFPVLSIKNVIPRAFPQWEEKVDEWGRCMKLAWVRLIQRPTDETVSRESGGCWLLGLAWRK